MKNIGYKIYLKYIFFCFIICIFIPSLLNSMTLRTGITSTAAYWKPWFIDDPGWDYEGINSNEPLLMSGPYLELENNSQDLFLSSCFKYGKETKFSSYTRYGDGEEGGSEIYDFENNYSKIKRYDGNLRLEWVSPKTFAIKPEFKYIYHESVDGTKINNDYIFLKGEYYIMSLGLGLKFNLENGHGSSIYVSKLFIKENVTITGTDENYWEKTDILSTNGGYSLEYNWIYNSEDIGFSIGAFAEWFNIKETTGVYFYERSKNKIDVTCGITITALYRIM